MTRRMERRLMREEMRDMRRSRMDGRNPYGSRGGYVRDHRGDYNYDMARDYRYSTDGHYPEYDYRSNSRYSDTRNGRDYQRDREYDMGYDYNYDMRGGRDRGYYDYARRRDYAGDYGETLTKEELEQWNKELMKEIDSSEKQYFTKDNVIQKARQMGIKMDDFTEDELYTATLMAYTDYCEAVKPFVGSNMEIYLFLGKAFLTDEDASVKGGEKLAVYHDCIVEDED